MISAATLNIVESMKFFGGCIIMPTVICQQSDYCWNQTKYIELNYGWFRSIGDIMMILMIMMRS